MAEITTAYRKLALTYHPDKVAHLAPEARELADQKMKEINAAYAQLKRHRRVRSTLFGGKPASSEEGKNAPPGTYADPPDAGIL
jgi:DnaJ-class molecular chaperone